MFSLLRDGVKVLIFYKVSFEKHSNGHKSKGRRKQGRVIELQELQEFIQQTSSRKILEKQNTVAVENPSLKVLKSKSSITRASSLSSSGGYKQSLKRKKEKEPIYVTDILSDDDDVEIGNQDSGKSVDEDDEAPVVPTKAKEPYASGVLGKSQSSSVSTPAKTVTSGSTNPLKSAGEEGKGSISPKLSKGGSIRKSLSWMKSTKTVEDLERERKEKQMLKDIEFEERQKKRDERLNKSIKERVAYSEEKAKNSK